MKKTAVAMLIVFLTVIFLPTLILAQEDTTATTDETKTEVGELTSFHKVIYKLWHNAWPKKDIVALTDMLPDIENGSAKIEKTKLPGILRDKKAMWEANVKKLGEIVNEYKNAVSRNDSQQILNAAEKLHAQYEALVRVIKPAIKELDAFHQVLYMLYHYYMPEYNFEKIQSSVKELQEKMDVLNKATLPLRLEKKQETFDEKRKELDKSVRELAAVVEAGKDEETVKDAINSVHSKYEALEKVFD